MRRFLGPVLVGLGVFLVVGGLLLRFYAYPRLAVAPIDQNSVTKLEAKGANIFDTTALKPLTTDLAVQNKTVGDVKASEDEGDNVRVWVGSTSIRSSDGTVRSRSTERTAFDATSAEAVNCCGNFEESTDGQRDPVKREGLVFKFPFATEKKTYQVWDDSVGKATPATFVKETKVDGLTVYEFQQTIDRVKVGTREVPASLVGGSGTGNVEGDNMYALDKQIFVEPVTGAIVDQHQHTTSTVAVDGEDKLTQTDAQLAYTKATVDANVKEFSSKSSQLNLVHGLLPLLMVVIGLVAIVFGVLLSRRREVTGVDLTKPRHLDSASS